MKKLLFLLFAIIIIAFGYVNRVALAKKLNNIILYSPCDSPLTYRLGSVDPRFNLSSSVFLEDIAKAGNIWTDAEGKTLFSYSPKGDIQVNLIYDSRQTLTNQINQLNSQATQEKSSLDPRIASYEKQVADFKTQLANLNQEIQYWNSRGGAPPDEYSKLKSEQQALQKESQQLSQEAQSLNQSTDIYNSQIQQLNQTVDTFNQALQFKPEEGEYIELGNEKKINIYFDVTNNELIHTLTHEMGHALGLPHNNNTSSIMYPRTTQALTPSADDLAALQTACEKRNIIQEIPSKLNLFIQFLKSELGAS